MTMPLPLSASEDDPFRERLRTFRHARGQSRTHLAAELGVTPATLSRWESGSTRPSPQAAERLDALGFGPVPWAETNAATVPRLKTRASPNRDDAVAELRDAGRLSLGPGPAPVRVLAAPFVRNGPPDQAAFHRRLLDLQVSTPLPRAILVRRLSMVEEVEGGGPTSQHQLERPRPVAVSWNSNYGTHGWHRYVGRFPAHVVRALLNHFGADERSVVCDPFVGSGTTAVECRLLGIPFVGVEICPLSAMMARTKAAFPADPAPMLDLARRFAAFYHTRWRDFVGGRDAVSIAHADILGRQDNPVPAFANVERWFTPEALLGTSIAVEFAMTERGYAREAILVALSSRMRSIGNVDVDVVRAEYSKRPRDNVEVGRQVERRLIRMAGDIAASIETNSGLIGPAASVTLHQGSALDVDLTPGSVDHIITSPPYGIEAISYLRTHLLSYRALVAHLEHDPYHTRDKTIGSEYLTASGADAGRRCRKRSATCREVFAASAPAGDDHRRTAMMQFCDDMLAVGERMARWLRPGGRVAFVIGNKRLGNRIIPLDAIVTELFATCGLAATESIRHKLKTNNSNSQVPWQERVIQEESILLFKREPA